MFVANNRDERDAIEKRAIENRWCAALVNCTRAVDEDPLLVCGFHISDGGSGYYTVYYMELFVVIRKSREFALVSLGTCEVQEQGPLPSDLSQLLDDAMLDDIFHSGAFELWSPNCGGLPIAILDMDWTGCIGSGYNSSTYPFMNGILDWYLKKRKRFETK